MLDGSVMLWKSLAFVITIHSQSNKSVTHGSYKKLKHFSKDFSRTFQGPNLFFKDPSWNVMLLV